MPPPIEITNAHDLPIDFLKKAIEHKAPDLEKFLNRSNVDKRVWAELDNFFTDAPELMAKIQDEESLLKAVRSLLIEDHHNVLRANFSNNGFALQRGLDESAAHPWNDEAIEKLKEMGYKFAEA